MSTSAFLRSFRGTVPGSHLTAAGRRAARKAGGGGLGVKRRWDGTGTAAMPLRSSLAPTWRDSSLHIREMGQTSAFSTSLPPSRFSRNGDRVQPFAAPIPERHAALPFPLSLPALESFLVAIKSKVPKGFENFFPKNGPKGSKDNPVEEGRGASVKEDGKSNDLDREDPLLSKDYRKSKQKRTRGGVPPPDDPSVYSTLLLFIAVAAGIFMDLVRKKAKNGEEITFVDFRNQLLDSGQVKKIVLVNDEMARVILHPGAPGISRRGSSAPAPAPFDWENNEHEGADETSMEFSLGSSESEKYNSPSSTGEKATPTYHFYIGNVESFEEKLAKAQHNIQPRNWVPVEYTREGEWISQALSFVPILVLLAFLFGRANQSIGGIGGSQGSGGIFQVGKSKAKKINPESVKINFGDVAGCQQAKQEIMEFVDFLKDATRFTKLGAKIPKGALLCGPPGTGKTLLAKAVAGEAGVPFFSISGSDFIEMFVGVGPSRVRDLFKEAREHSPCIVFIDEIDAVGRQRGRGFSGGNDERENTLNQLLVEMDGFNSTTGVVVLAGTNRADILDEALTRPGRFDRQIPVDKPDLQGRKEIFQVHLKGIKLEGDVDEYAGRLAGLTPGFAGADIANICNEAAIVAARREGESVTVDDFEKATDRIIGGLESTKIMSVQEKKTVAYHEAGHAVAGWFLEHADPLVKVTIIPRTSGALGYAQYLPAEVNLQTQEQIMDRVCMALAGRAAEKVFFDRVTTGASDDLRRVTQIVYSTIQSFGMNSRVGQLAYSQGQNNPGDKPYSDATAEAMDDEARAIVDAAYERTLNLIRKKKEEVEKVAKLLLEKETITHDDVVDLIGDRPFTGDNQYQEFVSRRHGNVGTNQNVDEKIEPPEEHQDGGLEPGLLSRGSPTVYKNTII